MEKYVSFTRHGHKKSAAEQYSLARSHLTKFFIATEREILEWEDNSKREPEETPDF